ncbi:MAG: ArnT family glycosyltransferase [Thainema sp.]
MDLINDKSKQKFFFIVGVVVIYMALLAWLDFLRGPFLWDERTFWETSLGFSDRLVPSLEDLSDYKELNTPLPFVIFGSLEYLFNQGIFAGRLLNLILSLVIVFLIGWPNRSRGGRAILCLIGLFMCPYYLFLSGRLYTEMIACFWMILGLMTYIRDRYLLSSFAFVLAIASRQYMIAFPAAIMSYEFVLAFNHSLRIRKFRLQDHWKWLAPLLAVLSLLFWVYLFQGLAPQSGLEYRSVPDVQQSFWSLTPGGAINFLAFVGVYIVIPEFILFVFPKYFLSAKRTNKIASMLRKGLSVVQAQWQRLLIVAALLLLFVLVYPPLLFGAGTLIKIADLLPSDIAKIALFYGLSYLACVRFSQSNLITLMVLFNSLIMMKAYPWDRYVLPLVVAFWYLKSIQFKGEFKEDSPVAPTKLGDYRNSISSQSQ